MDPFILAEDDGGVDVHFLWLTCHRKALIERKVARQRGGQKLGNVRHASQPDPTDYAGQIALPWGGAGGSEGSARASI